jgi:hypothetical protein
MKNLAVLPQKNVQKIIEEVVYKQIKYLTENKLAPIWFTPWKSILEIDEVYEVMGEKILTILNPQITHYNRYFPDNEIHEGFQRVRDAALDKREVLIDAKLGYDTNLNNIVKDNWKQYLVGGFGMGGVIGGLMYGMTSLLNEPLVDATAIVAGFGTLLGLATVNNGMLDKTREPFIDTIKETKKDLTDIFYEM